MLFRSIVHSHGMENHGASDKGLIDLAYRSGQISTVSAHTVYEHDEFEYELGLDEKLKHIPARTDRGAPSFLRMGTNRYAARDCPIMEGSPVSTAYAAHP